MAILIKELVVRVNIRDEAGQDGGTSLSAQDRKFLVKETADLVMELLREREER